MLIRPYFDKIVDKELLDKYGTINALPNTWDNSQNYKTYKIKQGTKYRTIQEPIEPLKKLQAQLVKFLELLPMHPACFSRKGYSTVSNALVHQGARHLVKMDIKDFYSTTHVLYCSLGMISIGETEWSDGDEIPWATIATAGSIRIKNKGLFLPTGAPTSPILSNIAMYSLDTSLAITASKMGFIYSRYFDDLTFSRSEYKDPSELIAEVREKLNSQAYKINDKKLKSIIPIGSEPMRITGVSIPPDGGSRVPRKIRRFMRARLDSLASTEAVFDRNTTGYMAYIKMLDKETHKQLTDYYEKRLSKYGQPT